MKVQCLLPSVILLSATLSCSSKPGLVGSQDFRGVALCGTFGPAGGMVLQVNPNGRYVGTTFDRDYLPDNDFCWIPTPIVFSSGTWEPEGDGIVFMPEMALGQPYSDLENRHASMAVGGMTLEGTDWEQFLPKQPSQANTAPQADAVQQPHRQEDRACTKS